MSKKSLCILNAFSAIFSVPCGTHKCGTMAQGGPPAVQNCGLRAGLSPAYRKMQHSMLITRNLCPQRVSTSFKNGNPGQQLHLLQQQLATGGSAAPVRTGVSPAPAQHPFSWLTLMSPSGFRCIFVCESCLENILPMCLVCWLQSKDKSRVKSYTFPSLYYQHPVP